VVQIILEIFKECVSLAIGVRKMARNRMIKPEFWSNSKLNSISRDARLTFIGIWNFCDDYGFCLSSTRSLLGDLYPYDESVTESKLQSWINELIEIKVIIPVSYKSKSLLFVKGWGDHQTVANKSKRAHVEASDLEEVIKVTLDTNEELISNYLLSHAPKRKKKEKEESNNKKGFQPPTLEEVKSYFREHGFCQLVAERAFRGYSENDWHDSKNNPIKNWKSKRNNGWFDEKNKDPQ
jgi:hypothetical protein